MENAYIMPRINHNTDSRIKTLNNDEIQVNARFNNREFDRKSNIYKDMRNRKIGLNEEYFENIPTPTKKSIIILVRFLNLQKIHFKLDMLMK